MECNLLSSTYILSKLSCIGYLVVLKEVDSTNQYLIDHLPFLKLGSVCLAETQTHGRGRYGKYWISPHNNFYLSFYWFFLHSYKRRLLSTLGIVISIVICELLQELGVKGVELKWPNDIYVCGRKLAGVLVEITNKFHGCLHVIIGIGINLKRIVGCPRSDVQVISLEEIGVFIDRNFLSIHVINILYRSLIEFEHFGFPLFFSRWFSLDNYCNQSVKLLIGNRVIFGISRGISNDGSLLLERAGSIYSYSCVENFSLRLLSDEYSGINSNDVVIVQ